MDFSKSFHFIKFLLSRWFWSISLILALCLTHELSKSLIESLRKSSIIIYTSDEAVPVTEIYFPAVSICQGVILRTDAPDEYLLNYTEIVTKLENKEIDISSLTQHEYVFIPFSHIFTKLSVSD